LYVTQLIPLGLFVLSYAKLSKGEKWFMVCMAVSLVTGFTSEMLYRNNINPNYAASTYYLMAPILYLGFFTNVMQLGQIKNVFYCLVVAHIIFSACNLLFIQKGTINSYTGISFSIIIISLSLCFFYRLLKNLPTDDLLTLPVFWFVTSEFIVNTGQMLFKSFAHFLIDLFNDNLIVLWVFHHGLGIAGHLVIIYGTWLIFRRPRVTTEKSA
jgi:O-antigen/teichoic acid export membrane protein